MTENEDAEINVTDLRPQLNIKARRAALAIMLAAECANNRAEESAKTMRELIIEKYPNMTDADFRHASQLANLTHCNLKVVDEEVQKVSPRWKVERMAPVDRNLLRLGTFELLKLEGGSTREVITDYVEIGREFGEKNTHAFINGLLDQLCQDHKITIA